MAGWLSQQSGQTLSLAGLCHFRHSRVVPPANLDSLKQGDPAAWNEAFGWLWPVALAVAKLRLDQYLPDEAEDVAIEALEALVERVRDGKVKTVEGLKPEVTSIARNKAISLLRRQFAEKRGGGMTISLDQPSDPSDPKSPPMEAAAEDSSLDVLDISELASLLAELARAGNPEHQAVIRDFLFGGQSYEEISSKRGFPIGTVGVYLKRGLEAMRKAAERRPNLLKELLAFLRYTQ